MEKQKNTQMVIIAILAVAVLTMSVGFATFSQTLNINGNATVTGSSWDVHFDETTYTESTGSVTVPAANRTISGTSITYAVSLTEPGDFYEFSLNAVNGGTFDAELTGITMNALTVAQQKYLTYTVTYNGTEYSATTTGLTLALNQSATVTVKVRVEYILPDDSDDLPATVTIPLTASLSYSQVD